MAITDDFKVTIHSNGKLATEYDDDDNAETNATTHPPKSNHIVKYIEAVPGEFFEFHYRIRHPRRILKDNAISFEFYVNGDYVTVTGVAYMENGRQFLGRFQFSALTLSEMDAGGDVGDLRHKYANLGTLRVNVWRSVTTGRSSHKPTSMPESKVVSEEAMKGKPIDVSTSYVRTPLPKTHPWVSVRYLDKTAIASFSFKYRTRRALQSLLIIEPDPVPVPLEERPIEELNREEMMTLLQRQKEQLQIKDEKKPIKRELSPSIPDQITPIKRIKGNQGQEIYVLDSDDEDIIVVEA